MFFSGCVAEVAKPSPKTICFQPELISLDVVPKLKLDLKNGKITKTDLEEIKNMVRNLRCHEHFYRLQNKNYERALKLNDNLNREFVKKWGD